ncbi:hypothetical protein ERO13_D07G123000v2 [Gossypium hirsutum]|nr:hypothetical protein ERO13_D07G123000v2 [Gossypium hirsutum]
MTKSKINHPVLPLFIFSLCSFLCAVGVCCVAGLCVSCRYGVQGLGCGMYGWAWPRAYGGPCKWCYVRRKWLGEGGG